MQSYKASSELNMQTRNNIICNINNSEIKYKNAPETNEMLTLTQRRGSNQTPNCAQKFGFITCKYCQNDKDKISIRPPCDCF